MPISLSGAAAYATPADLIEVYAWRDVADLLRPGPSGLRADINAVLASTVVLRHLKIASGRVELYSAAGGRYSSEALTALDGNAKQALAWLVSSLAFGTLVCFRFPSAAPEDLMFLKVAEEVLGRLQAGEAVWPLDTTADATTSDVIGRENRTVNETHRFFGNRRNSSGNIGY